MRDLRVLLVPYRDASNLRFRRIAYPIKTACTSTAPNNPITVAHHGWSSCRVHTHAHNTDHGKNNPMLDNNPGLYTFSFADVAIWTIPFSKVA